MGGGTWVVIATSLKTDEFALRLNQIDSSAPAEDSIHKSRHRDSDFLSRTTNGLTIDSFVIMNPLTRISRRLRWNAVEFLQDVSPKPPQGSIHLNLEPSTWKLHGLAQTSPYGLGISPNTRATLGTMGTVRGL